MISYSQERGFQKEMANFNVTDPFILRNLLLRKLHALELHDQGIQTIERAFKVSYSSHFGQKRLEGTPYVLHPLRVSLMLSEEPQVTSSMLIDVLAIGLLHDTLEDTNLTVEELEKSFGSKITQGVLLLSKSTHDQYNMTEQDYIDRFLHASYHIRLVKIYDRIDNLFSLLNLNLQMSDNRLLAMRIISETKEYYYMFPEISGELENRLSHAVFLVEKALASLS